MAALPVYFSAAFTISQSLRLPSFTFLPLGFQVEYCHIILCGITADAHLEMASQKCMNKGSDKHDINTKLASDSRGDEAQKFA